MKPANRLFHRRPKPADGESASLPRGSARPRDTVTNRPVTTPVRLASVVVIVLAHQGYWFGGQANELRFAWPIVERTPDAVLHWRLIFADTTVAEGAAPMPQGAEQGRRDIELPAAPQPTPPIGERINKKKKPRAGEKGRPFQLSR